MIFVLIVVAQGGKMSNQYWDNFTKNLYIERLAGLMELYGCHFITLAEFDRIKKRMDKAIARLKKRRK